MTIGIHTTTLDPIKHKYPILEAIASWSEFADEIVVVDGGSTDGFLEELKKFPKVTQVIHMPWSKPFCKYEFPGHLNVGLQSLTTDWAIKCDADYVFHERDSIYILHELRKFANKKYKLASFEKRIPLNRSEYHVKTNVPFAINKRNELPVLYGPAYDKDTDWCYPILFRRYEEMGGVQVPWGGAYWAAMPTGVPVWDYEYYFRTKEETRARFFQSSEGMGYMWGESEENAWQIFLGQVKSRRERSRLMLSGDHPKFIRERAMNVSEDCLGFNSWDL